MDYHFGIKLSRQDISVSHRQHMGGDKNRHSENYIAPIYCRFVNRWMAQKILSKSYLLKHERNSLNGKYYVSQNLTVLRRLIWERAETSLTSYQFKWVSKNGKIYVKKNKWAKPICLMTNKDVDRLITP